MLKIQEEQMKEYLKQIEESQDKPNEMRKIIRKEQRTWITILSDTMFIIVMLLAIYAMFNGAFQRTNILVDQSGTICTTTNNEKYPVGMKITLPNNNNVTLQNDIQPTLQQP